jgi:hypothetical protein
MKELEEIKYRKAGGEAHKKGLEKYMGLES